jgi:hypothetical protein
MMSATRAREMMIEHRKARVESEIYSAIKLGFIGVTVEKELISDALTVELVSLGYKVTPAPYEANFEAGVKIVWSEKV